MQAVWPRVQYQRLVRRPAWHRVLRPARVSPHGAVHQVRVAHTLYDLLVYMLCGFRFSGHRYPTALLFSLFLGILGVDRFYLGFTGCGVGKLLLLGGLGVWWIVDAVLLVAGVLIPADQSAWEPLF